MGWVAGTLVGVVGLILVVGYGAGSMIRSRLEQDAIRAQQRTRLRYRCASCGNTCLTPVRPRSCACGDPDWQLLRRQEAWIEGGRDWVHPDGEAD